MNDRFQSEEKNLSGDVLDSASDNTNKKSLLGDFSENIDSNITSEPIIVPEVKKFEVHIADFDDSPIEADVTHSDEVVKSDEDKQSKVIKKRNESENQTAAEIRKNRRKRRKKAELQMRRASRRYDFIKNLLIACVCIIFVAIITTFVSTVAIGFLNDVLVISDDTEYSAVVEIPEGATYDEVFDILCENGLVRQPFLTNIFLKFRNYDKVDVYNDETGELEERYIQYEPGMYYLNYSDGIESMIESIMVKSDYAKDTIRLTFPEGWSIVQIFEKLEKYGVCEAEKLYANLDIVGEQYGFISDIEDSAGRYLICEGYIFPDTYDFYIDESPSSVLKKLFNNFESKWEDEYNERLTELGITMDEAIIIASIIQREAKDGSQMKDISSVIHNRLNDPVNFPNIQMNSTSDYITGLNNYGVFTGSYFSFYLERYNTYKVTGLPPGPICNPGKTAINAALYPSDTNYYFFCHDKSGNVYYASTAAEHSENTSKVLYG